MENINEGLETRVGEITDTDCEIIINGKSYKYSVKDWTGQQIADKFSSISKHNNGRALSWLKKVSGEGSSVPAERVIRVSGDSAKILRSFVERNLEEINSNHKITTFFIDTDAEYKKYKIDIPAICLVCMDKRATKSSMKREPIVQKFDKSKTLKRYSDWKKGTVANVEGECWYTIYVSAKEARNNDIKALKEEVKGMKLVGYLNEEGSLVKTPSDGDVVTVEGEPYIVESVDGQMVNLLNEDSSFEVSEGELDEEIIEITANDNSGKIVDGMVCLGETELGEAYANDSDEVFIREAFTDKLEGEMVYRDRKTNKPIVTGELDPKKDTIMYWDTEGDYHTIKKSEFSKKFKAGKEEDFDLFEGKEDKSFQKEF